MVFNFFKVFIAFFIVKKQTNKQKKNTSLLLIVFHVNYQNRENNKVGNRTHRGLSLLKLKVFGNFGCFVKRLI